MTQMYVRWEIVPIGEVVSPIKEPISPDLFHNIRCTIKIYPEFAEGLLGLEEGKDILVLFLFHLNIGKAPLLVHPRETPRSPYEGYLPHVPYKAKLHRNKQMPSNCPQWLGPGSRRIGGNRRHPCYRH